MIRYSDILYKYEQLIKDFFDNSWDDVIYDMRYNKETTTFNICYHIGSHKAILSIKAIDNYYHIAHDSDFNIDELSSLMIFLKTLERIYTIENILI